MECNWSMCQNLNTWEVSDESSSDEAECLRKVASGKRVASAIRSIINDRDSKPEANVQKKSKENYPLMPLSYKLPHKQTSTPRALYTLSHYSGVGTQQCQEMR